MTDPPGAHERLRPLDAFTLGDLDAVRLVLRGDSIIDWHRLDFTGPHEVDEFLSAHEFYQDDERDRERLEQLKSEAIGYIRRTFEFPVPKSLERTSVPELLMVATGRGPKQVCACAILKCMHIINYLDGRELLFVLPLSDQEVFHLVEEKVFRVIGTMLAGGFPIIEFVGGRKKKDSLYTKLLSKEETTAAQIYDKLRFRIVTRSKDDLLPIVQYLTKRLFPFSYVVPRQSVNSIFDLRAYCEGDPHLGPMWTETQGGDDGLSAVENRFSAEAYRVLHFVVDMPVRLPRKYLDRAPASASRFGQVIFVTCEFQLVDRETDANNEMGEASHAKYKDRQKRAVMRRLQLVTKGEIDPEPLHESPAPAGKRRGEAK
jgi:uncharacterized protein (TIGR04552 family)